MNQPIAINTTRKHVVWLDVVRLVAMFTIVCCHSADPFNFYPGEPPANIDEIKFWGAAYGAFLRPCVPLFVMITGALLLPVRGEISAFYKLILNLERTLFIRHQNGCLTKNCY